MSERADRDALVEVVRAQVYIRGPIRAGHAQAIVLTSAEALPVADAILASDWLAQRDRRVAAEALRRFADSRGVNVGDEEDDYWRGYRQAQRECLHDAVNTADRIERSK